MEVARQALHEQKAKERQYRLDMKVTGGGDQPPQPPQLVPDALPASLPLYGQRATSVDGPSRSAPALLGADQACLLALPDRTTGFSLPPPSTSTSNDLLSLAMTDAAIVVEEEQEVAAQAFYHEISFLDGDVETPAMKAAAARTAAEDAARAAAAEDAAIKMSFCVNKQAAQK